MTSNRSILGMILEVFLQYYQIHSLTVQQTRMLREI